MKARLLALFVLLVGLALLLTLLPSGTLPAAAQRIRQRRAALMETSTLWDGRK